MSLWRVAHFLQILDDGIWVFSELDVKFLKLTNPSELNIIAPELKIKLKLFVTW